MFASFLDVLRISIMKTFRRRLRNPRRIGQNLRTPPREDSMSAQSNYQPHVLTADDTQEPPKSLWQALRKIGPGIVLAGSIVGSGELIVTTGLGAEFGFVFL